ncbi:hypothetical protein KKH56_03865 [bacterium]|nr:hypothetical protein [bacterium]
MLRFSANRMSPFLRDVVIKSLTSTITILSMIIVTRLLAKGLGLKKIIDKINIS